MQARATPAAWYALAALTITTLYAMVDRAILVLLTQELKADLHLSDLQIGSLQGVGAVLFTGLATIPLGWLADRMDRRLLLVGCIIFWTGAVVACGLSNSYWTLLVFVALLGAGEAGLAPVVYSMIPDLFSGQQRVTANFIYFAASILGASAGMAISGAVIDHIDAIAHALPQQFSGVAHWRLALFAVAAPGPLFAVLIATIRLKPRQPKPAEPAQESATQRASDFRPFLAANWRAVVGAYASFGFALLGYAAMVTWVAVILMRKFGLTPGQVGAGVGSTVAIGSVTGLLLATVGAKVLRRWWGEATAIRMPQIGFLLFALTSPLYLFARSADEVFLIVAFQIGVNIFGSSMSPTLYQSLAPAELRGRVFAVSAVVMTLMQTASPLLVGLLSDRLSARSDGLLLASIIVSTTFMLIASLTLWLAAKPILLTIARVQAMSSPNREAS
jgi:MFS family permease